MCKWTPLRRVCYCTEEIPVCFIVHRLFPRMGLDWSYDLPKETAHKLIEDGPGMYDFFCATMVLSLCKDLLGWGTHPIFEQKEEITINHSEKAQ